MKKNTLKTQITAELKQIWKLYTSAYNKTTNVKYDNELFSAVVSVSVGEGLDDRPNIEYDIVSHKSKTNLNFSSGMILDLLESSNIHGGVDYQAIYEEVWNRVDIIVNLLNDEAKPEYDDDVEPYEIYIDNWLLESNTQTEFISNVFERIDDIYDGCIDLGGVPKQKVTIELNTIYKAEITKGSDIIKVGCQSIPIEKVQEILNAYNELNKKTK